jgi:hypothetical protein
MFKNIQSNKWRLIWTDKTALTILTLLCNVMWSRRNGCSKRPKILTALKSFLYSSGLWRHLNVVWWLFISVSDTLLVTIRLQPGITLFINPGRRPTTLSDIIKHKTNIQKQNLFMPGCFYQMKQHRHQQDYGLSCDSYMNYSCSSPWQVLLAHAHFYRLQN